MSREEVEETLSRLKRGDYVTVVWIDASQSRGVSLKRTLLPNYYVETRKRTVGRFVGVQKGGRWRDLHLIIGFEDTDGRWEIVSIPLCLVKQIESAEGKEALKRITGRKRRQRMKDGGVKLLW